MRNNYKSVDYATRTRPTKIGKLMRDWSLEDYELKSHYMQNGMSFDDAVWKITRLNWEWRLCGWSASRLEANGDLESIAEAAKLRKRFGEEVPCNYGLSEYCTCEDGSCEACRVAARMRAEEEKDTPLPYTNEDWVNNFMSKVNRPVAEMSRR
jgi:hypothetical protein